MAELDPAGEQAKRAEKRAESRRRVLDIIEPRLMTILIFLPPTAGIILGGVFVTAYRRLMGQPQALNQSDSVTMGLGIFSLVGLVVILLLSFRVYRGAPTRFPRLLRVAPITALAGIAFGTIIAWLKATNRIH